MQETILIELLVDADAW